jgi:hypothetical protein
MLMICSTGTDTIKTEFLIDASKEVGLELNAGKTKHMLFPSHMNARQNIKITSRSSVNVAQFKCLVMTASNKKIRFRTKLRGESNVCYYSVQNPFVLSAA